MKKVVKKTHKRLLQGISATLGLILAMFAVTEANEFKSEQKSFADFTLFDRANADGGSGDSYGDYGGDGAGGNGI